MNLPLLIAEVTLGAWLIDRGWQDISGVGGGTASAAAVAGGVTTSKVSGNVSSAAEVVAAKHGWDAAEVEDWLRVISMESGGDPNAVNASSGAYGLGQMLAAGGSPSNLAPNKAKYAVYGGNAKTVLGQLMGMAGYIKERYGTPSAALAHENAYHWY